MMINYLPKFLQDIIEYKAIMNSEDIEIEKIKEEINNSVNETSIEDATEIGIARYEKILRIKTNTSLSLEDRKFLIKNKLLNRAPFTINWLKNKLENLCGKDNYIIDINYEDLSLDIQIGYMFAEATEELRKDLRNIIPANVTINVNFWYIENINVKTGIAIQQTEFLTLKQVN